ncbi:hypothetical protein P167DRAFT_610084 [Morchella conica CCBAS932]|uniref:Uncharacterized protein n=1 Tax=Morchella conica CCBAS932 TaxID=1392247 RepID=A0A3N4K7A0_9PEZI|nr:hypothetical protein P167DRAFT_610084 [Morchella conica CCBAS932]
MAVEMNGWVVRNKRDAFLPPEHSSLAKHPLLLDTQSAGVFELNDTFPSRTRRKIPPGGEGEGEGEGEEGEGGSKPNEQETRSHKSSTTADLDQRTTRQPPHPRPQRAQPQSRVSTTHPFPHFHPRSHQQTPTRAAATPHPHLCTPHSHTPLPPIAALSSRSPSRAHAPPHKVQQKSSPIGFTLSTDVSRCTTIPSCPCTALGA